MGRPVPVRVWPSAPNFKALLIESSAFFCIVELARVQVDSDHPWSSPSSLKRAHYRPSNFVPYKIVESGLSRRPASRDISTSMCVAIGTKLNKRCSMTWG